ncbi:MAG: hypothetical protein WDO15_04325 [Bacteroidota bacterium]
MKGSYKDDAKNGIFIYYTEKGGYSAAGVYNNDQRVGKWETFHPNGKMESEVYYRDRYFMKSYWDSTGVQMVMNGAGHEIHRYPNGVVSIEGDYVDGRTRGLLVWSSRKRVDVFRRKLCSWSFGEWSFAEQEWADGGI